ncbi:MAG: FAD binding domain-containing protein [Rhodospirillales bacterium]|jgi:2-furoyl-CoA dehydrogenase FAD binding subunit|nr:FAD binding domain-containing protein [Rhodospirillales bacterium]HJO72537.1 FAD binding domain-containing protein [Rhodospirillales bacterium]
MKPAEFDYLRAQSPDEALDALGHHGQDARVLAGGQSLMPMLNMRLARQRVLVDIGRIEAWRYVRADTAMIEIGAGATQAELLAWPDLAAKAPLLAKALPHVGHLQTRNQGTVCGSLCHADPSSELPLCLAVLGGEVVLKSAKGSRTLAAKEFQTGMLSTARKPDEIAVAARFPVAEAGTGYAFEEVTRRHGDFAIVAVAAVVSGPSLRVAVGGVADRAIVGEWQELAKADMANALNGLAWEMGGFDDIHATARYRRELVRRIGARVIEEATACQS